MDVKRSDFTSFMADLVQDTASAFRYAYCREDLLDDWQRMTRNKGKSSYSHHKRNLVSHLQSCGVSCDTSHSDQALMELIQNVPCRQTLIGTLFRQLHSIYRAFPSSADHMERLVHRLGDSDLQNGSVRLAIVRQFLRHTLYGTKAVQRLAKTIYGLTDAQAADTETVIARLDEQIFTILDGKLSDDDQEKYRLLIAANDLAAGYFRAQGGTRTDLYMFAFAFDMRVWVPYQGDEYDPDRDLEKNLFSDYYQYNLVSHLTEAQEGKNRRSEEPTGEGINPKSYVEVIYIYYLRQNLPRATRLKKANQLIQRCTEIANNNPDIIRQTAGQFTEDYWSQMSGRIWSMTEDQLLAFLREHYYIPADAKSKSKITIGSELRTAFDVYVGMLDEMEAFRNPGALSELQLSEETHHAFQSTGLESDANFIKLLDKMERLLSPQIPMPEYVLAKQLEDRHQYSKARWLLAVGLCLRQLHEITAGAVPKDNPVFQAYEAARIYSNGEIADMEPLRQVLYTMYTCCNELTRRNGLELIVAADRCMEVFQKQALHLYREPEDPFTFLMVKSCADKFAATMLSILAMEKPIAAKCNEILENVNQVLARLEQALPEPAEFYHRCRLAAQSAQPRINTYVENLRSTMPWLNLLNRLLEEPGEIRLLDHPEDPEDIRLMESLPDVNKMMKDGQAALNKLHRISRTSLIALAYHSYLMDADRESGSMPEILESFRDFVDPLLDQCRFQRLQEKNLFDMFTVFRLYRKCCLDPE